MALVNLEIAFQPCVSVITWSSLEISNACANIEEEIQNAQIFIKEVADIKEARVDEVFESIAETMLLKLDEYPKSPEELLADNIAFRDKIAIDLEIKSSAAEKAVIMIINKFLNLITDPTLQDIKHNWMDPEKIYKPCGSESRLIQGPFEPGIVFFKEPLYIILHYFQIQLINLLNIGFGHIERTHKVKISQVHNDCIELFACYNNKLIEALVKCTKNSLDLLKKKATIMRYFNARIYIYFLSVLYFSYLLFQIYNMIRT